MELPILSLDKYKIYQTFCLGLSDTLYFKPETKSLEGVSFAFYENILRLKSTMMFPAYLSFYSANTENMMCVSEVEITGKLERKIGLSGKDDDVYNRFLEFIKIDDINDRYLLSNDLSKFKDVLLDRVAIGSPSIIAFSHSSSGGAAVEHMLTSYATSAWTLFETLAGDLWEAALNEHPNCLANLSGRNRFNTESNENVSGKSKQQEKDELIKLSMIAGNGWDLRNKMGTILRRRKSFTTLDGIRIAYSEAFSKQYKSIDATLHNSCFDELSTIRNIIVHKGSKADDKYLECSKRMSSLPKAQHGEKIFIDGGYLSYLISEVINNSLSLLMSIDDWIKSN